MKQFLKAAIAAVALVVGSASALAANFSFTGNLAGDNSIKLFSFALASSSNVTLRTWSYAGGTNAAGSSISAGGFDPVVSLFLGSGASALLIDANDDGLGVAIDPVTGNDFDSLLQAFALPAGTYTVALTQSANFAIGPALGDGFLGAGNTGFDGRTSAWALDMLGVNRAASIPLPATLALALLGLVALSATRRRASASTQLA